MNTRGEIEYDYIKDPAEYYEVHYKSLYNNLINAGQTPEQEMCIRDRYSKLYLL